MCHLMSTQNLSWLHHQHSSTANDIYLGDQTKTLYITFMCRKLQEVGEDVNPKLHRMSPLMPTCTQNLSWLVRQHDFAEYDTHLGEHTKSCTQHLCV